MAKKVLIDEDVLNKLLQKALPYDYEVLTHDDALNEEEVEYLTLILMILKGQIDEVQKWVNGEEFKKLMEDVKNLPLNFFEDMEIKLRVYFHDKFELLLLPLLMGFYKDSNTATYQSLNLEPVLTSNDLLNFTRIRQYNYDLLTNLCTDLNKNFKDIILEGIINGKSVEEISRSLVDAGISPINKHTAQQRAEMIARTEVNAVKQNAKLQAYKDNNIKWVDIVTMRDNKVCPICLEAEANNPYSIEEAEGMIPFHTRCRCEYGASKENFNSTYEYDDFNQRVNDEFGEYIDRV